MATYFISRHKGAIEWAKRQNIDARFIDNLDINKVKADDIIMGSLPVSLVATICEKGGRYFHLHLPLSREDRGKELTADEMEARGARLEEFSVKRIPDR